MTHHLSVRIIGSSEGAADNQFSQPRSICLNPRTREVFVVDSNNHRVQIFDLRSLAYIRTIGEKHHHTFAFAAGFGNGLSDPVLNSPVSCCLDNAGHLYVSDTNSHRIVVFDQKTGEVVRTISRQGSLTGFVNKPYGICIDSKTGYLYVADYHNHRVQVFDSETCAFVMDIGHFGTSPGNAPGQFNEPIAVAVDQEHSTLLVADFLNDRIQIFNKDTGNYIRTFGGGMTGEFRGPRGICVDRGSKLLFVADRENHRIKLYNKDTFTLLRNIGSSGTSPLLFNRPMEMCVSVSSGLLFVVDGYNHRIQVIQVEELQEERFRLEQKSKTREAEIERLKNVPKASITAYEANPRESLLTLLSSSNDALVMRFPYLGPLYDVVLDLKDIGVNNTRDMKIAYNILPQLESVLQVANNIIGGGIGGSDEDDLDSKRVMDEQKDGAENPLAMIMDRQASAFLDVISTLQLTELQTETSASAGARQLVVPSTLALHSLLERAWTPKRNGISTGVISCLSSVLGDLNNVAVSEDERVRVVRAVVSILSSAANSAPEAADFVYTCILKGLDTLDEPVIDISEDVDDNDPIMNSDIMSSPISPKRSAPKARAPELRLGDATVAHLNLIRDILLLDVDNPGYSTHHIDEAPKSIYHKDLVNLIFGPTLASCSTAQEDALNAAHNLHLQGNANMPTPTGTPVGSPVRQNNRTPSSPSPSASPSPSKSVVGNNNSNSFTNQNQSGLSSPGFASPFKNTPWIGRSQKLEIPPKLGALLDVVYKLKKQQSRENIGIVEVEKPEGKGEFSVNEDLGVNVLKLAADYFSDACTDTDTSKSEGARAAENMRGGNSIWQKGEQMLIGDLVDAMDKEKCWFEALITEVRPGMNIKVHFMGWGSKWDDIVTIEELETRIAPLNTQTKNWRGDLFEGGLIEIKCNEDTVNQKWMWGKIIAMSVAEEWVDVSYSFSNEPVILKRANLYGETICPIGMHTKDRSKAVSATIVRPPQRAEELLKAKEENIDDVAFYDRDDELLLYDHEEGGDDYSDDEEDREERSMPGSLVRSMSRSYSIDGPSSMPHSNSVPILNRSKSYLTELHNDSNPMDVIAKQVFEVILREVVTAVTRDVPANASDIEVLYSTDMIEESVEQMAQKPKFAAAVEVLKSLITGPYKRLLAPYFCRVLTVQCGLRTKLLVQTYAEQSPSEVHSASDSLMPAAVLRKVRAVELLYSQLTVRCLGDFLSVNLMRRVVQRIGATVSQCARAVIAAGFITQLSNSNTEQLQHVFIRDFLESDQRVNGTAAALRGVLTNLLKVSKIDDQRRLSSVWVDVLCEWVIRSCQRYVMRKNMFCLEDYYSILLLS